MLVNLMEMSTNNPSQKSVVLDSSVKPSLGKKACPGLDLQKIQEPLTQDNCAVQGLKKIGSKA